MRKILFSKGKRLKTQNLHSQQYKQRTLPRGKYARSCASIKVTDSSPAKPFKRIPSLKSFESGPTALPCKKFTTDLLGRTKSNGRSCVSSFVKNLHIKISLSANLTHFTIFENSDQ
jgi:hypothetical protein